MFVDELKMYAKAGDGGNGVVRWRQEKFKPMGGPSGGNGGKGGDVYVRAVRNLNLLAKYTGLKEFIAENGESGGISSQFGKGGNDLYIDLPIGSRVANLDNDRVFDLTEEGETVKILHGGQGGLGNEYFKSSTNRAPQQSTPGKAGESGNFFVELILVVDVGLIGMPNAGKSTLLNNFTNATSKIGSYAFTTLEPHLGELYGFVLADIPGLIEGAAGGKGLGHKFLRHVTKTKMLLHLVSLDGNDPAGDYYTISKELADYDKTLLDKEQWIILTKKDLVNQDKIDSVLHTIDKTNKRVFVISTESGEGVKELRDSLVLHLRGS
jgi:GTPase